MRKYYDYIYAISYYIYMSLLWNKNQLGLFNQGAKM